jgi:tetratricopeptide (TPR) repeat protein
LGLDALTLAHLVVGQTGEAVVAAERALTEARSHRSGLFLEAEVLAQLARARLAEDDPVGATRAADEAVTAARQRGTRVFEGLALLTRSQVRRATGAAPDDVLSDLDAALDLVKETGALAYEPLIHEELGRLRDDESELREALRLYTAMGAAGHARRLGAELDGLSQTAPVWHERG